MLRLYSGSVTELINVYTLLSYHAGQGPGWAATEHSFYKALMSVYQSGNELLEPKPPAHWFRSPGLTPHPHPS